MEYRLYSFVNYYLSPIQQGIQTGHAAVEIMAKYLTNIQSVQDLEPDSLINGHRVKDWAKKDKTFVILNGGNSAQIKNATSIISASGFPFAPFYEDNDSLDGIQTCVAAIVPETVFNTRRVDFDDDSHVWTYNPSEADAAEGIKPISWRRDSHMFDFVELIRTARLA